MVNYEEVKKHVEAVTSHIDGVAKRELGQMRIYAIRHNDDLGVRIVNDGTVMQASLSWEGEEIVPRGSGPILKAPGRHYCDIGMPFERRGEFRKQASALIHALTNPTTYDVSRWGTKSGEYWDDTGRAGLSQGDYANPAHIDVIDMDTYKMLRQQWLDGKDDDTSIREWVAQKGPIQKWIRAQDVELQTAFHLATFPCGQAYLQSWQIGEDVACQYSDQLNVELRILNAQGDGTTSFKFVRE